MKKVIVTGATGFIGSHVVKELVAHGVEVIAVVRKKATNVKQLNNQAVTVVRCDMNEYECLPELIQEKNIDILYHFSWQGVYGSDLRNEQIQLENVQATLKLIDVCAKMNIPRFIGAGSIHEIEGLIECSSNKWTNNLNLMYKTAKLTAHHMARAEAGNLGIEFLWPIITNTYGEGEKSSRLIVSVIKQLLNNQMPKLTKAEQLYDFVYITDLANAFYQLGDKGIDQENYIIGSGNPKPLKEYLKQCRDIVNKDIELGFGLHDGTPIYVPDQYFDITTLRRDIDFSLRVSFELGIRKTMEYIKQMN